MNVDKALAKFSIFSKMLDGGDTGKRRVEHGNILQLWFTNHLLLEIGQKDFVLVPINIPE